MRGSDDGGSTDGWATTDGSAQRVALEVLRHGPLARTDLARRLDLSAASLSRLTAPLVARGLLVESGARARPGAGRPAVLLDVVAASQHVVGVKVTATHAHAVLVDLRGDVVASHDAALPASSPAVVVDAVADAVARLARTAPVAGVGVSVGGQVTEDGTVRAAPFLGWADVPLTDLLHARTGLPCAVRNDVDALVAAEHWYGVGRRAATFAVLTVGAGPGYGAVVHDRPLTHVDAGLGLVGHVPVADDGPPCALGHRGCASGLLARDAVLAHAADVLGRPVAWDDLLDLARAGDPAARAVVDVAGAAFGRLVALVANLLVPAAVVAAGEGVGLVEVARHAVDAALADARHPAASTVELVVRPPGFGTWARGAAVAALQRLVLGR